MKKIEESQIDHILSNKHMKAYENATQVFESIKEIDASKIAMIPQVSW